MKTHNSILLMFIFALFCNGSCEYEEGQQFLVQNNSGEEIIVVWSFNTPIPKQSACIKPTTEFEFEKLIHSSMVKPHSSKNFERNRVSEWLMSHSNDTLYVGVFNLIDIDTMSCEQFEHTFPIKHEWRITLADMKARDWILVYP